jgi:hypothetical protein
MEAILDAMRSVNHIAPSGPAAMRRRTDPAVGTACSVIGPTTLMRVLVVQPISGVDPVVDLVQLGDEQGRRASHRNSELARIGGWVDSTDRRP